MDARPTAAELVDAVAEFLTDDVVVRLEGRTAFHARVAVNVLRIVQRELEQGGAVEETARSERQALPGAPADAAAMAELIRSGALTSGDPALRAHLIRDVRARIAVDSPSYPSVGVADEHWS